MLERRGDPRLAQEALAEALVACKRWSEDLQRHAPTQRSLLRRVHRPHRTATEQRLDSIAGDDRARPQRHRRESPLSERMPSRRPAGRLSSVQRMIGTVPPSTDQAAPVTYDARSEQRKT